MHPSFAYLSKKLVDLDQEYEIFRASYETVVKPLREAGGPARDWAVVALISTGIEGCYTGMEGVLKELVLRYDGRISPESFHTALLAQAAVETEDRPAILSNRSYELIDELRKFRHVERNVYRHVLRLPEVEGNYERLLEVIPLFKQEVSTFVEAMSERLEAEMEPSPEQGTSFRL